MTTLIIVVLLTIFISANCSLYESVLYSCRMSALEAARKKDPENKLSLQMINLKKNISQPIAAILILNTIANTAGATVAGMVAVDALGASLVPLFSAFFTLGILFLSEIMPKTIGAVRWRKLWPMVVFPLRSMSFFLHPLIWISEKFTRLFTREHKFPAITEDEILALVHMGTKEGEISKEEGNIVHNLINLENRQVREIMTPRPVMFTLNAEMTVGQASKAIEGKGLSRVPIYQRDRENIIGYVLAQEVYSSKVQSQPEAPLKTIAKPLSFVQDTHNCLSLLINFLKQRKHLAIVTDEFGGVDGLVTLEDLLETMLGAEIVDETDQIVDLQEAARKRAAKRGKE